MTNLSRGPERPAADRTVAARGTPTGGRRSTRLPPVRVDLGLGPPVVLLEEVGHVEVVAVVERHLARGPERGAEAAAPGQRAAGSAAAGRAAGGAPGPAAPAGAPPAAEPPAARRWSAAAPTAEPAWRDAAGPAASDP